MLPVTAETLLRRRDGTFGALDETARTRRGEYVEGAIVLTVWGVEVLDTTLWDDVDYLWRYLADMVEDLVDGKDCGTYFPDQPVELSFRNIPREHVVVSVRAGEEKRTAAAPKDALLDALRTAGNEFFDWLDHVAPVGLGQERAKLNHRR
ncbi:hypothetical protein GCM10027444_18530 [Actinopolyspora lacussalsi]